MKKWQIWLIVIGIGIICSISIILAGIGTFKMVIQNSAGTNKASFADNGNAVFAGKCLYGPGPLGHCNVAGCIQTPYGWTIPCTDNKNCLLIQDSTGKTVAYINSTGDVWAFMNMTQSYTMANSCYNSALNITDKDGMIEACFDNAGNLFTRGTITCNGSP